MDRAFSQNLYNTGISEWNLLQTTLTCAFIKQSESELKVIMLTLHYNLHKGIHVTLV